MKKKLVISKKLDSIDYNNMMVAAIAKERYKYGYITKEELNSTLDEVAREMGGCD